jgi:uncharacterized RDD family membrane protein YckC
MTMTAEEYISRVMQAMPRTMPLRTQIAMELRGHITERMGSGLAVDEVLRQLGDPVRLAESYLSAEPLVSASFGARAAAKVLDVLTIIVALSPVPLVAYGLLPSEAAFPTAVFVFLVGGSYAFGLYTIVAEYVAGQTLGKRLVGVRVVTDTGARITFGQAIVRQLPMFLQVYMVDVMFALFTEHGQRAFELLSQTRTVRAIDRGGSP